MSSNERAAEVNGFGMHSLRVEEAWLLYRERYPTPPDNRVPSGGWGMAPNGIPVPPVPNPGTRPWLYQVSYHRRHLSGEDRRSPLWRMDDDNNEWWLGVFHARWEADMRDTEGLIGAPTSRNVLDRDRWWGGEGRTLDATLDLIHTGGEWLEMSPTPPPSDRKSTRLNSSHITRSRMPSSA